VTGGWVPETVERLKVMCREGMTASAMAKVLGTSRNAVIGKAHRCGFKIGAYSAAKVLTPASAYDDELRRHVSAGLTAAQIAKHIPSDAKGHH
jgi:hypothetical protein